MIKGDPRYRKGKRQKGKGYSVWIINKWKCNTCFLFLTEHPRVSIISMYIHLRMRARARSRDCLSRAFPRHCCATLLFHRCCICPVVMLPDRESTRFSSRCVPIVFFSVACPHVTCQSATRRFGVFATKCRAYVRTQVRTSVNPVVFHTRYRHFFARPSSCDFVGPPHILDSAVLISELWARRDNSHSKNDFFRRCAVMER